MVDGLHACVMSMYQIIEVEPEWVLDDEPMGTKDKFWVNIPDDPFPWLFKYSRLINAAQGVTAGEHWSEKAAGEIAKILKISCATVEIGRFEGSWGSLCRRFEALDQPGCELAHGNEILSGAIASYDIEKRYGHSLHTLGNIIESISKVMHNNSKQEREQAFLTFGAYLVLDALIMNVDRHHENWGMLRSWSPQGVTHTMAPSFDHASSLGREKTPNSIQKWVQQGQTPFTKLVKGYIEKGRGGIYASEHDQHGKNPLALVRLASRKWPDYISPCLENVQKTTCDELCAVVENIPRDCIDDNSIRFACEILNQTHQELSEIRR